MPFEIRWLVNQKVIYAQFSGEVNEAYMRHAADQIREYLHQVDSNTAVHLVIHSAQDISLHIGISKLFDMLRFLKESDIEYLVRVGPPPSPVAYKAQLIARSLSLKYQQFDTLEDALIFLQAADTARCSRSGSVAVQYPAVQ